MRATPAQMMARLRRKIKHPKESVVQRDVVAYLKLRGCAIYSTSQGYRPEPGGTRMSPGIPDLLVWFPDGRMGWFEVKSHDGQLLYARMASKQAKDVNASSRNDWRRTQAQAEFAGRCLVGNVPYARGGLAEAQLWMEAENGRR
jgi:hypothetical protein